MNLVNPQGVIATYDVIVAGLGAMGSAAVFHLSKHGMRVLGLDQFHPPHDRGSSHGHTRIIREAYFEHPAYVPLVQRAYTLWFELEQQCGQPLFVPTGGLMIGAPDGILVQGARTSAQTHRLTHEVLDAPEIHRRFPALHPAASMIGILEPRAGVLRPEACIRAHLELARAQGAHIQGGEEVTAWAADGQGVEVVTSKGRYRARRLVLSAGSWLPGLWPGCPQALQVERQVQCWFPARQAGLFEPARCPIHMWEYAPGRFFYGIPDLGQGAKVARHHEGVLTNPTSVERTVSEADLEAVRQLAVKYLPGLDSRSGQGAVCLYTNTLDGHFLLDRHPDHFQILVASPCSGHGFKFSSVIGEIASQWARDFSSGLELELFAWRKSALQSRPQFPN